MRGLIDTKSNTCTESADVDVTDIRAKVSAHYPGRSDVLIITRHQKSANAVCRCETTTSTEGLHVRERERTDVLNFRYEDGDAERVWLRCPIPCRKVAAGSRDGPGSWCVKGHDKGRERPSGARAIDGSSGRTSQDECGLQTRRGK